MENFKTINGIPAVSLRGLYHPAEDENDSFRLPPSMPHVANPDGKHKTGHTPAHAVPRANVETFSKQESKE
jgi:hypothetical protein